MAGKEATVYVVDLGASTGDCNGGRVESDVRIFSIFSTSLA
jgi:hypothetical protein